MKTLRAAFGLILWTTVCAVGQYEAAAKLDGRLPGRVPGSATAQQVERETPYLVWSGVPVLDLIVHEGTETLRFYERLLSYERFRR